MGERWLIYWTSLYGKNKAEAITVGSQLGTVQSIDYSRVNHLYKINIVTLNTLSLWNFEKGGEGKYLGEDRSSGLTYKQKGKKLYQKIFIYEGKNWKPMHISLLLLIFEEPKKSLRKNKSQ